MTNCTSQEGHEYTARVIAEAPGLAGLMEEIASMFKNSGAVNYLEMQFGLKDDELGPLVITIQRKDGKTPHELRVEADTAHASLQQENERLKVGIGAIVDGEEYYKGLANAEDYDSNIEDICSNLSALLAGGA